MPIYLAHPVIAVVDATDEAIAVWWIRLPRMANMGDRLCGAWTLEHSDVDTLEKVIARRIGLATTAGQVALDKASASFDVGLDLDGTLDAVDAARAALMVAFDAAQKRRPTGQRLAVSRWPDVPEALDLDHPPVADALPRAARALGTARYVDRLVETWDKLEDIRTNRSVLNAAAGDSVSPNPEPQLLPFVLNGAR